MTVAPTHGAARISEEKQRTVVELSERLARMNSAVLTDHRGLTVAQLEALRASLRAEGVDYVVVKNTLARRASEAAGVPQLSAALAGPTALAIGYGDLSAPARLLMEYARSNRRLEMVRGGIAEGQLLSAEEVRQLAELPPREVLMAQLLGMIEAPVAQLVQLLQAPVQDLVGLLTAKEEQAA
ncbi:MAG: 50S ribosomal protein L10 [Candidatus Dormiibacterota bacterium]